MDSINSSLPLPPSPPRLHEEIESDNEPLPPPPPEMFRSNLSLDSLPPPPAPGELPICKTPDLNGSFLSLVSLPPPPSPLIGETGTIRRAKPKQSSSSSPTSLCLNQGVVSHVGLKDGARADSPQDSCPDSSISMLTYGQPPPFVPPPTYGSHQQSLKPGPRSALKQTTSQYAIPPYLAELKAASSPQFQRRVTIQEPGKSAAAKKISFSLPTQQEPGSPALPQRKPLPPRRSDSTRLTSPKKLAASEQAPPGDFLKDLQRVMRKKWQVAQKCKLDSTTTPHEVLGFRDPPPAVADYRETNVSNWVQEHYGSDNLYENVYATEPNALIEYLAISSPVKQPSVRLTEESSRSIIATAIAGKRRPPPPPPKRAETTQLTTKAMH